MDGIKIEIKEKERQRFQKALLDYIDIRKKDIEEVVVQRFYNVAGRVFGKIPPADVSAKVNELYAKYCTPINERGLTPLHLMIQKARGRRGEKGLYGRAMRDAFEETKTKFKIRTGFLKAIHKVIHDRLFNLVKYKKWPPMKGVIVYNKTKEYVKLKVDLKNLSGPRVEMEMDVKLKNNFYSNVLSMLNEFWNTAIHEEYMELYNHLAKMLEKEHV